MSSGVVHMGRITSFPVKNPVLKGTHHHYVLDDEMSEIEPLKAGELIEPIVFEPKRKIRLSRSTYKVNSYIDFRPYQDSFKKFEAYIHRFSRDLWDPDYVGALVNMHRIKEENYEYIRKEVRHTLVQQHVGMQPMIVESRDSICK